MIKSQISVILNCNITKVWDVITNNINYNWRTDILKIEIIDDINFIEYDKNGYKTNFEITHKEYLKKYEFNISNDNLKGHWIGLFKEINSKTTEITLVEEIETKKMIMKILAKPYLKKQQEIYIKDLKNKLLNEGEII